MAFISYENKYYVLSKDIRVFPCAYRGYYDTDGTDAKVFDPEARSTTESNFTNTFQKLSLNKTSYVVDWSSNGTSNILKCVIDGYYFEIKNCTINDFFSTTQENGVIPNALCILPKDITLSTSTEDDTRNTKILSSFTGDEEYLDSCIEGTNNYIFTGLCIVPYHIIPQTGVKRLIPFKATAIETTDEQGNTITTYVKELNHSQFPITNILDAGSGKFSVRMISDIEEGTSNSTETLDDYAVAFGKRTKARKYSGVIGNKAEATGESSFAFGEESKAQGKGSVAGGIKAIATNQSSVAFGDNVTTTANNQVVIGKYNQIDNTKAFIIANGTNATDTTANKFTVSYEGNVATKGNLDVSGTLEVDDDVILKSTLETKGNISATGTTNNDLILGTSTAGSYGSISIYGEGNTKVFEAKKTGDLEITGKAKSTSRTSSTDSAGTLTTKSYVDSKISSVQSEINSLVIPSATDITNEISAAINTAKSEINEIIEEAKTTLTTNITTDINNEITTKFQGTVAEQPTAASTGTGKYVQSVTQADGKITTTECNFATTISATNTTDAPTAAAVHNYVATSISNIWENNAVKPSSSSTTTDCLKDIILNAAYPVGSIYLMYSDTKVDSCPIENTLGGSWSAIEAGRFLVAASSTTGNPYTFSATGGYEETQLKAHSHELERNSDYSGGKNTKTKVTSATDGAHSHNFEITARAHDAGTDTGLRSGDPDGGTCHKWTFSFNTKTDGSHAHSIDLTNIRTAVAGDNIEGTPGTNLPPYLAVYMWKRIA